MDQFHIVLFAQDQTPVVAEIIGAGYPLHRATTAADAARLASTGACFLFVDQASAQKFGPELVSNLEGLVKSGNDRICLLDGTDAIGPLAPLVGLRLPADLPIEAIIEQLSQVLCVNQRSSQRALVALHATLLTADDRSREGSVHTLSEGGASFVSLEPPPVGMGGLLTITAQNGETVELDAQVMNERRMEKAVGMRFLSIDEQTLARLRQIVHDALGSGARRAGEQSVAVFDQNALARTVATVALRQAGYAVSPCATLGELMRVLAGGAAALLIEQNTPSLTTDRLVEVARRAGKTKVIMHTGAADDAVKKAQVASGWHHVIKKGTFADVFVGRVGAVLGA